MIFVNVGHLVGEIDKEANMANGCCSGKLVNKKTSFQNKPVSKQSLEGQ